MANFRAGQRVVYWNEDGLAGHFYGTEILPTVGKVYTIRELLEIKGHPLLRLVEIRNEPMDYRYGVFECAFNRRRFRPVVERKTDISIFKKMLNPNHDRVSV